MKTLFWRASKKSESSSILFYFRCFTFQAAQSFDQTIDLTGEEKKRQTCVLRVVVSGQVELTNLARGEILTFHFVSFFLLLLLYLNDWNWSNLVELFALKSLFSDLVRIFP